MAVSSVLTASLDVAEFEVCTIWSDLPDWSVVWEGVWSLFVSCWFWLLFWLFSSPDWSVVWEGVWSLSVSCWFWLLFWLFSSGFTGVTGVISSLLTKDCNSVCSCFNESSNEGRR